jgi:hypothetical protein
MSESTNTNSIDARKRNEEDCKLFDELAVTWFGLVVVAVELLLGVVEGTLVLAPVDCEFNAVVGLSVVIGVVFELAGA